MKYIALLSSMPFESGIVLSRAQNIRSSRFAGKPVYRARLSGCPVVVMNTGVGKANAAHSATGILETFPVRAVINFGVGGAYPGSGLHTGDIAVATQEIYGDEGVESPSGWSGMKRLALPLALTRQGAYYNHFPLDRGLSAKAESLLSSVLSRSGPSGAISHSFTRVRAGNFVTVSAITSTRKRASVVSRRFRAVCESMEGASHAHVCALYNIPLLEIRGISNDAGIRDKRKWDLSRASDNSQAAVLMVIRGIFGKG